MTSGQQVGRLRERLAALSAISQTASRALDLEDLFRALYEGTSQALDVTGFILGLYDEGSQTVEVVRQMDSGVELSGGSFPLGTGFTSEVIRTRRPRLIRRWSRDEPRVQVQYATDRRGLPESGITVPLLAGEKVVGVLSLQSYQPEAYDEDDLLMLQAIAGQAAAAIENLRHSARLDVQLRRRVSELEIILASMADALVITDAAGAIVRLNEAARTLLGLGSDGIILGQPLDRERWGQWPLGGQAVAEALRPIIEALRRGEVLRDVEVELQGKGQRVLCFSGAPLHETAEALAGGVIVFRDVTGRREVERLKDEVLSIASHDLRTPLTVIKGFAELLRLKAAAGGLNGELLGRGLMTIEGQADRLEEWLHLLLDLTRMKGGQMAIEPAPADLVLLASAVLEGARVTTGGRRLVLRAPPSVEGTWDSRRLEQVFQNLITNALKYSPRDGTVEVTIHADDHTATVCVRDEGIGLAADELPRIFDRFYRATGVRQIEGSGLGLYICQAIVTAHGGRIWAESAGLGSGSAFYVSLPRGEPEAATAPPGRHPMGTPLEGNNASLA